MSNYIIEGNFDFYKELYESLDDSDNNILVKAFESCEVDTSAS